LAVDDAVVVFVASGLKSPIVGPATHSVDADAEQFSGVADPELRDVPHRMAGG
jgi:hypothetical protein